MIGQNASDCSIDQLQDLREHMRAETGMLVVGGADEQLRLSHRQKREEGLTQAMADRCIIVSPIAVFVNVVFFYGGGGGYGKLIFFFNFFFFFWGCLFQYTLDNCIFSAQFSF